MQIGDSFVGRDREVAQLDRMLGPGDDGLRLAMISGPSGLGKTTLAGVALEQVADRYRIVRVNGRAGAISTPFAPWLEAVPELEQVIADTSTAGLAIDMEQVGIGCVTLLGQLTAHSPVLIAIDDAQALDESSIALLPYIAGVSEQMNLTLLVIEQSDAPGIPSSYRAAVDGLLARRVVQHLELAPMQDDAVATIVATALGLDSLEGVPTEIVLRAQGNPWFAKELAESYARGETEIPATIAAAATARLHRLEQTAQDVVYATALCPEGAHVGWLERLVDEKPRHFVRTLETIKHSGLVREDGDVVSIAHPLMQQTLIEELSSAMRRALHQELADVVAATPLPETTSARAMGYHLSKAGRPDEAVSHYLGSAEANEIMGRVHEALADYVRALDAEPRIDNRIDLLKRAAYAAMQIGSERAGELWSELGRIAAGRGDNELYAYALFQQYWSGFDGSATDRLERAAALGPAQYGWSARAAACLHTLAGDYGAAIEHDSVALRLAQQTGDFMLETLAQEKLGMSYAYQGDLPQAIATQTRAVELATAHRLHGWALVAWGALAESYGENLETERSLAECRAAFKYLEDIGLERYRPLILSWLAGALARSGRVEEALQRAEEAFVLDARAGSEYTPFVTFMRAEVGVEAGDVNIESLVATAVDAATRHGYVSFVFEAQLCRAKHLARNGDIDGALAVARELQVDEPAAMANLSLWLTRMGTWHARGDAIELAQQLRGRIADTVPVVEVAIAEIDTTIAARDGGSLDALCAVADRWQAAGRPLDALRALTSMSLVMIARGDAKGAIAHLNNARVGFSSCGAASDVDFVAQKLRSLGTRSRARSRTTKVGNLTKRELEIARLVSSGMRNADVASHLFLAEKTVAAHLSNIYGKLEVRSRVQLATWLKQHDVEPAAVA